MDIEPASRPCDHRDAMLRLRELRKERGWSQEEVASRIGCSAPYYNRLENSRREIGVKWLSKLADLYGLEIADLFQSSSHTIKIPASEVEVVGAAQAGQWLEAIEWSQDLRYRVPVTKIDASLTKVFGLEVRGPSMNLRYPEGTVVICQSIFAVNGDIRSGDDVVCERRRPDGLVEATVKELVIDGNGAAWLWPRSNDPHHQAPLEVDWPPHDPSADPSDIEITAVVLGAFVPRRRGLLPQN